MTKYKIILLILSLIGYISISCEDDKSGITPTVAENEITVSLIPEEKIEGSLRKVNDTFSGERALTLPQGYHLRYIVEVYTENEDGTLFERVDRRIQTTTEFTLKLSDKKRYTLLAWADFISDSSTDNTADGYYQTNILTNVQIKPETYTLNNRARDAFFGKVQKVTINSQNIEMALKRPFALLRIKDKNSEVKKLKIKYPSIYKTFDVFSGDVKGATSELEATIDAIVGDKEGIIAFDYLFTHPLKKDVIPEKGSSLYDIEIEASTRKDLNTPNRLWSIQYVPFSRNYRTTLEANFMKADKTSVNISIDDDFETPNIEGNKTFIVSSYVRTNFYKNGSRISEETLLANNDLIILGFNPYTDGTLYQEFPENNATFTQATFLDNFKGRKGIMDFAGNGTAMNAGSDLLHTVRTSENDGSISRFTFGTWIYIDTWNTDSYLFKKEGNGTSLTLKLGETEGELVFGIGNETAQFMTNNTLTVGKWHHIALVYKGSNSEKAKLYIDGTKIENPTLSSNFPSTVPFIRSTFKLAVDFDGKLDETFIHRLDLSENVITNYKNGGIPLKNGDWFSTNVFAYWKYDDASRPGKDLKSWKQVYNDVRKIVAGRNIKVRLGLSSGDWKQVFANETYRSNFVNSVYNEIVNNKWDGVDFDFEWSYSDTEYANYSATVIALAKKLKPLNVTFSLSLHPISYKISQEAINAVNFISMQIYGPQITFFGYDKYIQEIDKVINYGIPANKLVPGLPFYSAKKDGSGDGTSYLDFVNKGLITSPDIDEVTYTDGKIHVFNGQTTIRKKVRYARNKNLGGIMYWDTATDVTLSNQWSLLKVVKEELGQ